MTSRDEDARRLAGMLDRWHYIMDAEGYDLSGLFSRPDGPEIVFPAPDAPLHEHLAFVGRLLETLPHVRVGGIGQRRDGRWFVQLARTTREDWYEEVEAPDLSWAAVKAALAAKESR